MIKRFLTTSVKKNGRLIPLIQMNPGQEKITVYIKGFLSRGEEIRDFSNWRRSHYRKMKWEPGCFGYAWQNKHFKSHFDHVIPDGLKDLRERIPALSRQIIPLPVMSMGLGLGKIGYSIYLRKRFLNPWWFMGTGVVDLGLIGQQIYTQYYRAKTNATTHASLFTEQLRELKLAHPQAKIRLVAHSLGCKLALRAVDQELVDELHLLAPAVTVEQLDQVIEHHQGKIPVDQVKIYYSNDDLVLRMFGLILEKEDAIGLHGLDSRYLRKHANLEQEDVSEQLEGLNRHKSYSWTFNQFVK